MVEICEEGIGEMGGGCRGGRVRIGRGEGGVVWEGEVVRVVVWGGEPVGRPGIEARIEVEVEVGERWVPGPGVWVFVVERCWPGRARGGRVWGAMAVLVGVGVFWGGRGGFWGGVGGVNVPRYDYDTVGVLVSDMGY